MGTLAREVSHDTHTNTSGDEFIAPFAAPIGLHNPLSLTNSGSEISSRFF